MSTSMELICRIWCEIHSQREKSWKRLGNSSPKLRIYLSEDIYSELLKYRDDYQPLQHTYNKEGYKIKFDGHPVFIVAGQTNYSHVSVEI